MSNTTGHNTDLQNRCEHKYCIITPLLSLPIFIKFSLFSCKLIQKRKMLCSTKCSRGLELLTSSLVSFMELERKYTWKMCSLHLICPTMHTPYSCSGLLGQQLTVPHNLICHKCALNCKKTARETMAHQTSSNFIMSAGKHQHR